MNLEELSRELARFEKPGAHEFQMPAPAGEEWASVAHLLQTALGGTLSISGVTLPPTGKEGTIAYAGTAPLFPWSAGGEQKALTVTAIFSLDAAARPQLRIDAVVPAGWRLPESLEGLGSTTVGEVDWAHGAFLLSSQPATDPSYPGGVQVGVNFSGQVSLTGPFANAGPWLGTAGAQTVSGPIALIRGEMPEMTLASPWPCLTAVEGLEFESGARLRTLNEDQESDAPAVELDFVEIEARLLIGAAPTGFEVPLLPGGEAMPLQLSEPTDLSQLGELTPLSGVSIEIPSAVPFPQGLTLKRLTMPIALSPQGDLQRSGGAFDIGLVGSSWQLLPNGILTLGEVGLRAGVGFGVKGGPQVFTTVYGTVTLAKTLPLQAAVSFPGLDFSMNLDDGTKVPVGALLEQLMEGISGRSFSVPVPMDIVQLDFVGSVRTGQFSLAAAVETGWRIEFGGLTMLALEGVSLAIEYDGSVLGGWIEAETTIAGADSYVSASTAGGEDAGWDLAAGLKPGAKLNLIALMKAFMYPSGEVPGETEFGLARLEIDLLDLSTSLSSENKPENFRIQAGMAVGWKFELFGATELKLAAALDLHGNRLPVPLDDSEWDIEGRIGGSLSVYGLRLEIGYEFHEENSTLTFAVLYGERGIRGAVTRPEIKGEKHTVLTVTLGDLSLGEILDFLIGLAVPGEKRQFSSPWDFLYKINFRGLELKVDLTNHEVSLTYPVTIELGFASVTQVGLVYRSEGGEGKVLMQVSGDFLGLPYGTDAEGKTEPVTWDVVGEQAPPVPGKGDGEIEIRYVGLGQHVALPVPDSELKTVEAAIKTARESMGPPAGGGSPLGGKDTASLRYDAGGKWLFALEAELVGTVRLAAVLYDPHLYGALLELSGERAGSLAGLRAELVYRRINDQIGEFSVDLQVPEQFRNWEFGAVSITLGLIHVDVYTNGNFRVDIGFPAGGSFARSFTVQVFPFIGRGGFYFAYLTGATSERVPAIENGSFDPVIEAGVGLTLGVGKEIKKGPLKAGMSLEVSAIFEGVYAPFHPYAAGAPAGAYFWFQGTAEIIGKLYGAVDFVIVKAEVSVVARARAVVAIEAYRATHVELELEVRAEASIEILFVKIHFSFEMSLDASFTLGEDSTAPWVEAPRPSPSLLRAQRSQAPRRLLTAVAHLEQAVAGEPQPWAPVAVKHAAVRLQFLPGLTIAESEGANQVEVVLVLGAENTIAPGATSAEEVREVSREHLHADAGEDAPFVALVKTFLRWAAKEGAGVEETGSITRAQLQAISDSLHEPGFVAATFAYENLSQFIADSLTLELLGYPAGSTAPTETSTTFVPMVPALTAVFSQGTATETRDYSSYNPVSERYAVNLAAYFAQFGTDYKAAEAGDPLRAPSGREDHSGLPAGSQGASPSAAEALFGEYFALLTRTAVQTAIDLLTAFPYPYPVHGGPSLTVLAEEFDRVTVALAPARGQTPEGLAAEHGLDPEALAAQFREGLPEDRATVEVQVGPTALSIAEDNQAAPLAAVSFTAGGLAYQVRAGQSLEDVAAAVPQQVPAGGPAPGPLSAAAIGRANAGAKGFLRVGASLKIPAYDYTRIGAETDQFLEVFFAVRNGTAKRPENLDWYLQAISGLNQGQVAWQTGETINVPRGYRQDDPVPYTVHAGDDLERVAETFAIYQAGSPGTPPTSPTYRVAERGHAITAADTFAGLAEAFPGLGEEALIGANLGAPVLDPLAVAVLPDFAVAVQEGQSLADLAAAFDLALPDLVALVGGTPGLFLGEQEGKPTPPLTIADVPAYEAGALIGKVGDRGNEIAAQVSRFLLHGLGVPSPADESFTRLEPGEVLTGKFTGPLEGLYAAAGMQCTWDEPGPSGHPLAIELSSSAGWLKLFEASVDDQGKVVQGAEVPKLSASVANQPPFDRWLPATTLDLQGTSARAMPLTAPRGVHYELQSVIHWQAAEHPSLGGEPPAASPGEPSIWLLPASLRQRVAESPTSPTPAYELHSLPLAAPPGSEGNQFDPHRYAWAVHVPFTVRRVAAAPAPGSRPAGTPGGEWLPTTYVIDAVDQAGEDVLFALAGYLGSHGGVEEATRLQLLYEPDLTGGSPGGLASGPTLGSPPRILKTNLATETRAPFGVRAASAEEEGTATDPETFSAGLDSPAAFVEFLWEATTVLAGGFYLRYDVEGKGIPDSVFDQSGRATLTLLCLLGSQAGTGLQRGLFPFSTCAVVSAAVDPAATQVYAVQTGGTPPQTAVATVPPGNVGFEIERPPPGAGGEAPAEERTQMLYNLFGYRPTAGGGFRAGNEGLPAGPGPQEGGSKLLYEQVIQASKLATESGRVPQHCPALPQPQGDPYAGVGKDAALTVDFAARDSFGNAAAARNSPAPLALPFRYSDPLVAVGEWPGASLAYRILPTALEGGTPLLEIGLDLQASNYLPAPAVETPGALRAASLHAHRYERVLYQLRRPRVAVSATSTLGPTPSTPLPLSAARFTGFAAGAYVFTSQLAGLTAKEATAGSGETLKAMAHRFSVTVASLLAANAESDPVHLFAGTVAVPVFGRLRVGQSIETFAAHEGVDAATLLRNPANAGAPVPAGTTVAVPPTRIAVEEAATLAEMAAKAGCRPGDIATANETAAGLLADGVRWQLRGSAVLSSAYTFKSLVEGFEELGVKTTAAELATANADQAYVFKGGTDYLVVSYTVPAATTVGELKDAKFGGSVSSFLECNGSAPGVLEANALLELRVDRTEPTGGSSLRTWVERTLGVSLAQFAAANAGDDSPVLRTEAELVLPALLDPERLTAVPYALGREQSLAAVAGLFGTDAQKLGAEIQDIGGIFVPDQPVTVGTRPPLDTEAEDSLAGLLARFPAPAPSLAELIDAVSDSKTLLRPGAILVCPVPTTAAATSLEALASGFGVEPAALGQANAALDGFLAAGAALIWEGEEWGRVGPSGTLTSLYERVAPDLEFEAFLAAIAGQDLVAAGTKVMLPPPGALATASLPADPPDGATIATLRASVAVSRPPEEAASGGEVTENASPVPARCEGRPASYRGFAKDLEDAYGGRLKVAVGKAPEGSTERLHVVRLGAPETSGNAIRSVEAGSTPTFFALPPLCRELISREVEVRLYQPGSSSPLSALEPRSFRAIDPQGWARSALAAIDLVLSAPYAGAAFALTATGGVSATFDALVAAKKTLVEKIAAELIPIVPTADPQPDPGSAQDALRQSLALNLTAGWDTAAVVQVPTAVSATFGGGGEDAGGHRLAGKPLPSTLTLGEDLSLDDLADQHGVDVSTVPLVLGETPNLLKKGVTLRGVERSWEVGDYSTLAEGAAALGISLEALGRSFAAIKPLFRKDAAVTVAGFSAVATAEDTLAAVADRLATDVSFLVLANQGVAGLFQPGAEVEVEGKVYRLDAGTTPAELAARTEMELAELAGWISGQRVLATGATFRLLAPVPEHTLSASKIDLDRDAGHLDLLLGLADPQRYRRLLLPLDFAPTGLEYGIEAREGSRYETSDWLQMVRPLAEAAGPARIETSLGRLEVPVPLRAYPTPPRLVAQTAVPATKPEGGSIDAAKQWDYLATFETDTASQDLVDLSLGFNWVPAPRADLEEVVDPFRALAEFATNQTAIEEDLAKLLSPSLQPGSKDAERARSAVAALASIAGEVAGSWGQITPDPPPQPGEEPLVARLSLGFTLDSRIGIGADGEPVVRALLLDRRRGAVWGPEGLLPKVGYVDDDGGLVLLEPREVAGGPTGQRLEYRPEKPPTAFRRRVYTIAYKNLDALQTQSARTGVAVERNAELLPGVATEPAFVYRTPETHFADVAMPALVLDAPVAIGSGTAAGLAAAAAAEFAEVLPDPATIAATRLQLTVRYGYQVGGGEEPLAVFSPIAFRPLFAYDATVPTTLTEAVEQWLGENAPAPGVDSLISLDLTVFADTLPERRHPLLELHRLDYALEPDDSPPSAGPSAPSAGGEDPPR